MLFLHFQGAPHCLGRDIESSRQRKREYVCDRHWCRHWNQPTLAEALTVGDATRMCVKKLLIYFATPEMSL